jgi:hypothetical protein
MSGRSGLQGCPVGNITYRASNFRSPFPSCGISFLDIPQKAPYTKHISYFI